MTIVEFLEARLAEDEFVARNGDTSPGDEARVLREVEAKRAIMAEHYPETDYADPQTPIHCAEYAIAMAESMGPRGRDAWPCTTLRHLAAIYADHLDYDEAWRA